MSLERYQVWIYLAAIGFGLAVGAGFPQASPLFERLLWPVLIALLYATFLQVPLVRLWQALSDRRFVAAMLLGNFVALPVVVWVLVETFGFEPATRLGVLMVLLVPCTDWFIAFSQLGKGDTPRAVACSPLNLVLQLLLLPAYLWLMAGERHLEQWELGGLVSAACVVLAPLAAAALTEVLIGRRPRSGPVRELAAWAPVPLLGCAVFLIAAAHVRVVADAWTQLAGVVPAFILFLALAVLLAKWMARRFALPADQGRTLAFSFGTRNSFVVLPLALSLPAGWEMTPLVIVTQSMVELFGMMVYMWVVPGWVFPCGRQVCGRSS